MKRSLIALTIVTTACTSDAPKTAEDSAVAMRAVAESTIAAERQAVIPKGESASTTTPPLAPAAEKPAGDREVTFAGMGPIKAGMSMDEARIVMHGEFDIPANLGECGFIKPKAGPKGVIIMVEKGEISRVDVTSGTVATVEGVKIGDTEDRIKTLYPGQVEVQPHKYTDGHYLVVTPKGGGNNRIVFETDGKKVLRYRSGRMPAVQYVEGCS